MHIPKFVLLVYPWSLTIRVFGYYFQVKTIKTELFSQRNDPKRVRFLGLSFKFGDSK